MIRRPAAFALLLIASGSPPLVDNYLRRQWVSTHLFQGNLDLTQFHNGAPTTVPAMNINTDHHIVPKNPASASVVIIILLLWL